MTSPRRPSTIRLLFASSHPGPTVTVTVLAAVIATAVGYPFRVVVLVALAVVAGQLSIGLANDWIDADRDRAVGRSDKPVARGIIAVTTVRTAAFVTAGVAVVLSLFLGPVAAVAHVVLVAAGWAYDGGLKRTAASVVPFVVAFGLLPVVAVAAGPDGGWPATWAIATGAVFGVAIHCTNVLPDLVDDAATGVRGVPAPPGAARVRHRGVRFARRRCRPGAGRAARRGRPGPRCRCGARGPRCRGRGRARGGRGAARAHRSADPHPLPARHRVVTRARRRARDRGGRTRRVNRSPGAPYSAP
ncbi:UbiA family prenyltransferase [Curtobacterium sp. MCPF17_052]|uniref:UbiA family prenyltransferase n=1 Tax=Curtobacterium sp. MCPF17_052 TaxID=2175655 RepID=UPI0024E009F0|nr:UbiA family prenyltransferase [Curtobacterium sp. MCPF17_052]WIB13387.1 UbiA family prenyltransferase [Curtobacterium sp. MCPF17_052]